MEVESDDYKNHIVFKNLEGYIDFYDSLSMSIFGFVTMGTRAICNIDTYVYSSIHGTLESIRDVLANGRINDAYALLRKYYDSAIINVYSNLYLKDHFSIENFIVAKINDWLRGKEQIPEYRVMSRYLRASQELKPINDLLYADAVYKELRDRCNDNAHYNFFKNVLLNDKNVYLKERRGVIDQFSIDLEDVFILHISYIFYLNDHYMMSSDYVDSLDCGMVPEEGSQYFVAPFVQEAFDQVLKTRRSDLMRVIKEKTAMVID